MHCLVIFDITRFLPALLCIRITSSTVFSLLQWHQSVDAGKILLQLGGSGFANQLAADAK